MLKIKPLVAVVVALGLFTGLLGPARAEPRCTASLRAMEIGWDAGRLAAHNSRGRSVYPLS